MGTFKFSCCFKNSTADLVRFLGWCSLAEHLETTPTGEPCRY